MSDKANVISIAQTRKKQRREVKKRSQRSWDEIYEALSAFYSEHGHCNVPKGHPDTGLTWWISKQRRNRDELTAEQRRKLSAVDFDLSTLPERLERAWNARFKRLKEFRRIYAHTNVPQTAQFDPELELWAKELGDWVQDQRQNYKKGKLSNDRRKKLESIHFEFSIKPHRKPKDRTKVDEQWHQMYLRLLEFHEKNGHCLVPRPHRTIDDPEQMKLAIWVSSQRKAYADNELPNDRKQLLDELEFAWKLDIGDAGSSLNQQEWEDSFAELVKFKDEQGHCEVPRRNEELGAWLGRQKTLQCQGRLDPRREQRLLDLGVEWIISFEDRWDERYAELRAFQIENGHCLLPKSHHLSKLVHEIRSRYKQGKLPLARKEALDCIGFSWDPLKERWDEFYLSLKQYKAANGNCDVPQSESPELYNWVQSQRQRWSIGKMSEERKEKLDAIGFSWQSTLGQRSNKMFTKTKTFIETNGHSNVPWSETDPFYRFVSRLRKRKRDGLLDSETIAKFDSIGFDWGISLDDLWDERFEQLEAFKSEHGHCSVPKKYSKTLQNWVQLQRAYHKAGTLPNNRRMKLESIGFKWGGAQAYDGQWDATYAELIKFKRKHGHCYVPGKISTSLQFWTQDQRRRYKAGKLSGYRREKLDSIDFEWEGLKDSSKRRRVS